MSEIRNLTRNGQTFYPLTTSSAVINEATGEGLIIDDEPTAGSDNLVKSGGVFDCFNEKVNATDYELPTELDTFEYVNNVPLQHISKGDKLIARFKPLTNIAGQSVLAFLVRFFYTPSDNNNWVIPEDFYTLGNDYLFEFNVERDCEQGYPIVNLGCSNFGGTFELELYKYVALKEEIEKKQDALVSGQNIKTINGLNILGSGNINIDGGSFSGKKILWLGTSLPAGDTNLVSLNGYEGVNKYPEMVGYILNATVYNEAVGGTRISASRTPSEYNAITNPIALSNGIESMFEFYSSLGATIEEKDFLFDNWQTLYTKFTDGVSTPPVTKAQMEAFSFEKKVIEKYIADNPSVSKVDLIVIEHGFNDRNNSDFSTMPMSYSESERFYYKGAMSYLIRKIYELNSRAKIIIPTVYSDMEDRNHTIPAAIKDIAEKYNIPFIDYSRLMSVFANGDFIYTRGYWDVDGIWHETGFTWQEDSSEKGYTTNDNGFCSNRPKSEWLTTFDLHEVVAGEDLANAYPVGTLVYKCPRLAMMTKDNLHPYSDRSGYLNMQVAQYLAKKIKELIEL